MDSGENGICLDALCTGVFGRANPTVPGNQSHVPFLFSSSHSGFTLPTFLKTISQSLALTKYWHSLPRPLPHLQRLHRNLCCASIHWPANHVGIPNCGCLSSPSDFWLHTFHDSQVRPKLSWSHDPAPSHCFCVSICLGQIRLVQCVHPQSRCCFLFRTSALPKTPLFKKGDSYQS
jgi:hypothetical protein